MNVHAARHAADSRFDRNVFGLHFLGHYIRRITSTSSRNSLQALDFPSYFYAVRHMCRAWKMIDVRLSFLVGEWHTALLDLFQNPSVRMTEREQ